jgi:hypothetical protein
MVIYFWNSVETFLDNKDDLDFVKSLQRFIDSEVKYSEYIRFLSNYGDKYKKLESVDTFMIFKQFQKQGQLSVDNIVKFMNE